MEVEREGRVGQSFDRHEHLRDGQRKKCSLERLRSNQIAERRTRKVSQQQRQGREYFMKGVAVVSKAAERTKD